MFLVDNTAIEGCDIVKQCIINHSGVYRTVQLYIHLPICFITYYCFAYCSYKYDYCIYKMTVDISGTALRIPQET